MEYTKDQKAVLSIYTNDFKSIKIIPYKDLRQHHIDKYHPIWLPDDPGHYHLILKKYK